MTPEDVECGNGEDRAVVIPGGAEGIRSFFRSQNSEETRLYVPSYHDYASWNFTNFDAVLV